MAAFEHDEYEFYNPEAIEAFAAKLAVTVTDTLKYIYSNYTMQANAEDFKYFNDDMRAAFRGLRDDCLEFVNTFDYYNFCNTEPYPADKEDFKVIIERSKAYSDYKKENFVTVLAYPVEE